MRKVKQREKKPAVYIHGKTWPTRLWRWGRRKVQRQVKDRLFRFLFETDREALLQLYNALNETAYQDVSGLQIVTIESAVYVVMKNDMAFVLAGTLNLYEHQSTFNPNMPVRFMIYLAEEYQKLIKQAEKSLYGTKQIFLPVPKCVVFYNGEREMPEEHILRLSDAYGDRKGEADVELRVKVLNINYGYNKKLMEKCQALKEYALFVEISRQYARMTQGLPEAINMAVDYCIEHGILSEFLEKYRAEVLGMLLEEFDVDKYESTIREEGREEGKQIESRRSNMLICVLLEQNRIGDLRRSTEDPEYREQLMNEICRKE